MEKLYELDPVVLPLEKPNELELVVSEFPPRWLFSSPSPDLEHGADEAVAVEVVVVEVPQLPPPWLFSSPSPDLEHGADEADVGVLLVVCWAVLASSPSS